MNSYIQFVGAAGQGLGLYLRTLAVTGCAFAVSNVVCSAAFLENFQDDTVGSTPTPNWTIGGANGTTATGNVGAQGTNNFLAFRDLTGSTDLTASRSDFGGGIFETRGFLQFDIRFNQGIDAYLLMTLYASKSGFCASCLQPIDLEFFHNAFNTNTPLLFRSRGNGAGNPPADPNAYALVTNNFPIGSWQTIRVDFTSSGGLPRGTFSVSWNGITNNYLYLNQNDLASNPQPLAIDRVYISTTGATTASVDFDNFMFIPEPSAALLAAVSSVVLALVRRRLTAE